ncbi:ABC transporter ATP-binding protein [Synechococcus sp. PCC 7336]|uniref:ABC transporter ATP-binding protein n=1 Tax=Synechococcus sp. PCC 7336 TaxID=195250 RepID=UPI0003468A85|nr:ABC transporter ATP-binding protein [Synechococcus sp. PCC 7336]
MNSIQRVLSFFAPYTLATIAISLGGLLFAFINLLRPYLLGLFANLLAQSEPIPGYLEPGIQLLSPLLEGWEPRHLAIATVCLLFFSLNLISPFEDLFSHLPKRMVALHMVSQLNQAAYRKVLTLPLSYFESHNSGLLVSRLERAISKLQLLYISLVQSGILVVSTLTIAIAMFFIIDVRLGWVFTLSIALCATIIFKLFTFLQPYVAFSERLLDRSMSRLAEVVLNIKTVKAFTQEVREYKRGQHWLDRYERFMARKTFVRLFATETVMWMFLNLSLSAIVGLSAYLAIQNEISVGGMITAITIAQIVRADVSRLQEPTELLTTSVSAIVWLHEFLHLPLKEPSNRSQTRLPRTPGRLSLHHIYFRYRPELPPTLIDLSLDVPPYATVALVGPSGSGKSTLTKLLYRFADPTRGRILWDGKDIRQFHLQLYRSRLAMVPQEVEVFNGTVMHNLLYGRPKFSPEQAVAAAKLARAHDFIVELPRGYHTNVGERGVRLSGGQRQRLGIARAILMRPAVLILDEATSNLDSESEHLIQQALRNLLGTCTVIVIAHRLSTIREADIIVVMEGGRIVERGTHQELMRSNLGLYQRLHKLQMAEKRLANPQHR